MRACALSRAGGRADGRTSDERDRACGWVCVRAGARARACGRAGACVRACGRAAVCGRATVERAKVPGPGDAMRTSSDLATNSLATLREGGWGRG